MNSCATSFVFLRRSGCAALLWVLLLSVLGSANTLAAPVSGTLSAVGSDTMAGLILRWGEALSQRHPDITIQFQASGSANAPSALIAGTTRLGPMSRQMTDTERQAFTQRYGYPPLELKVARDALAVIVHRHNPLSELTRQQVDALFSNTLQCGADTTIKRWQDLPATQDWPFGAIALHGRDSASGTYGLFQQRALCGGEFRQTLSQHPGASAVVAAVGESPGSIGYAGYHHLTPNVKAVSLINADEQAIALSENSVQQGTYPLSRYLYLYANASPEHPLPAAERALLRLIFSLEGQKIARSAGFVPLSETVRQQQARW